MIPYPQGKLCPDVRRDTHYRDVTEGHRHVADEAAAADGYVYRVTRPTIRFVAVGEQTSALWWAVMVGFLGAIPFYLAIAFIAWILR